ncbi:MAG: aldolase/citrate lyase family protein, partial [bacterium]|nr:aldolase/citrate lyase family protein [bacterium]
MPKRINKAIELLEQDQMVYYTGAGDLSYEGGKKVAKTWADYIQVSLEHRAYDIVALEAFMKGLVDGGPTNSGHRTPAVFVDLPVDGGSEATIRANAWMFKQVLARGVHGILLVHAETPEAVTAFVESCRYSFHTAGVGEGLGVGRRGSGGQGSAANVWGVSTDEYLQKADVWPLNPEGEIMLGLKIENRRALENAEGSAAVPGISFAEWGPGDMGMAFGHPWRHDPPYPDEMV